MNNLIKYLQIDTELKQFSDLNTISHWGDIYFSDNDAIVVAPDITHASTNIRLNHCMTHSITIYDLCTHGDAFYKSAQPFGGNIIASVGQIKILTLYDSLLVLMAFHCEEKEFDGYASAFPEEYTTVYFYNLSTKSIEHSCRIANYNIIQSKIVQHEDIIYLHNCIDTFDDNYDGCFNMINLKTKKCNNIHGTFNFPLRSMYIRNNALILNVDETMSSSYKRLRTPRKMQLVVDILHLNISKYGVVKFDVTTKPSSQRIKFQQPHIKIIYTDSYGFVYNRKKHRYIACFNCNERNICCYSSTSFIRKEIVDMYCPDESVDRIIVKLQCGKIQNVYTYIDLTHQTELHNMYNAYTTAKRIKDELADFM